MNNLNPVSSIQHPVSSIPHRAFIGLSMTIIILVGLSACASLNNKFKSEEDPQIARLQHELDRIERLNITSLRKLEDIRSRLVALQAKADRLEANLGELTGQRLSQSQVTVSAQKGPANTTKPQSLTTRVAPKQTPKKRAPETDLKKTRVLPKKSPEREYKKAYEAYATHHFDRSIALFRKFLQRYSKHDLADNAQYWIGEAYYDMKDYPHAILAFKEVVALYAEQSKSPDALLKIGYSYVALDDLSNARIYFKKVIENYPFSEAEAKARAKLKEIGNP